MTGASYASGGVCRLGMILWFSWSISNHSSVSAARRSLCVTMMTEELYRRLQNLGSFDLKTSSWIATPDEIRSKGGALFCERRYDTVFTFHNGADSYYSVRGFRGYILI